MLIDKNGRTQGSPLQTYLLVQIFDIFVGSNMQSVPTAVSVLSVVKNKVHLQFRCSGKTCLCPPLADWSALH
jgi:hypothetical protein